MKRYLIIIVAAIMIICLSACGGTEENKAVNESANRQVLISYAGQLAIGINAYNALHPNDMLPDDVTFEEAKAALEESSLWPRGIDDETARNAWAHLVIVNGEAIVPEEGL